MAVLESVAAMAGEVVGRSLAERPAWCAYFDAILAIVLDGQGPEGVEGKPALAAYVGGEYARIKALEKEGGVPVSDDMLAQRGLVSGPMEVEDPEDEAVSDAAPVAVDGDGDGEEEAPAVVEDGEEGFAPAFDVDFTSAFGGGGGGGEGGGSGGGAAFEVDFGAAFGGGAFAEAGAGGAGTGGAGTGGAGTGGAGTGGTAFPTLPPSPSFEADFEAAFG